MSKSIFAELARMREASSNGKKKWTIFEEPRQIWKQMGFVPINDPNLPLLIEQHKREQRQKKEQNQRNFDREPRIFDVHVETEHYFLRVVNARRGYHAPAV